MIKFSVVASLLLLELAASSPIALSDIEGYTVETVKTDDENRPEWSLYDTLSTGYTSLSVEKDSFTPIQFSTPFFTSPSVEWYVSQYGFLSPTASPLCDHYCESKNVSKLYGSYGFLSKGAGDWPMAAIFSGDLFIVSSSKLRSRVSDDGQSITVEYQNFGFLTTTATFQAVLYKNGTIIFRYKQLAKGVISTGLIFSQDQRSIIDPPPAAGSGVLAYRFTPIKTQCGGLEQSACTDSCQWCTSLQQCVAGSLYGKICPQSNEIYEINVSSKPFVDKITDEDIDMNFGVNSAGVFNFDYHIFYSTSNFVSFVRPGALSNNQTRLQCNPIWGACPNGNYSHLLLPFQSAASKATANVAVLKHSDKLANLFCDGSCPPNYDIFYVTGITQYGGTTNGGYSYSYLLYVDLNSKFQFYFQNPTGGRLYAYPEPLVGIVRNGVGDPKSVLVPASLVQDATFVTLQYISKCSACGEGGACDAAGTCVCQENYQGTNCDECKTGFYGPTCLPCVCTEHGKCDDGMTGRGGCLCESPYTGRSCEKLCDPLTCPKCNENNGYCDCDTGKCRCHRGWSGDTCEQELDRCLQYTIYSCMECIRSECEFCSDLTCFSPPTASDPTVTYTCSQSARYTTSTTCPMFQINPVAVNPYDIIVAVFLGVILLILLIGLIVAWYLVLCGKKIDDRHSVQATGGAPNFRMPRKDREVVYNYLMQRQLVPDDQLVMGIPLRQIQLETLYRRQNVLSYSTSVFQNTATARLSCAVSLLQQNAPMLYHLWLLLLGIGLVSGHAFLSSIPPRNATSNCELGIHLEWSTRVSGSVIATPRVVDIGQDGEKELLIPTFSNYVEMLRGASGEDYPGFPFVHPNFKSYSNPQPIDVDGDGTVEWLVATYTGELLVFGAEGRVRGLYRIPPLSMKKNWWESKDKKVENLARTKLKGSVETKEFMSDILKARGVKDLVLREDRDNEKETPPPRRAVRSENTNGAAGPDAYLSKEAFDSLKLLFNPDLFKNKFEFDDDDERFHYRELRGRQEVDVQIDEIAVDPHIMSTPVLVDIDNNGDVDAVIHVTYFFEDEDVPNPQVDPTTLDHYLATAVVCLNLVTGEVRWVRVLGISKKSDPYPTYGLSTPLVVDADESKSLEIYVTSTNGRVDRLNSDGSLAKNWPVYMGPITASPAAEDVTGDGTLDICVGDIEGKVACFDQTGKRIWIRHVVGGVTDRVSFGDVNSDQEMEVVFSTSAGFVYAVHGANGSDIAKFPIVTGGSITAPTLVIQLSTMLSKGLHVVVPAHDGNVYFVDAVTGCIETIDIDEPSSTLVLADDLTNSGYINLIVTTVKGGVYVFQTSAPYSNLNTWPSEVKGLNGFTAGSNHVGVFIADAFRKEVNLRGEYFFLPVTVMDQRLSKGSYLVQVFIGSRVRVYRGILSGSMTHRLKVRAPLERMRGLLTVQVTLPNGQVFTDVVAVAFNLHFLETVKYTLVVPFLLMCFGLFFIHKRHEVYMS